MPCCLQQLRPFPQFPGQLREVNKAVAREPPGRALSACCGQVAWAAVSQSPMILVITGRSPGCCHAFHCQQRGWRRVLGVRCLWRPYRKVSFQRTTSDTFSMSPPAPSQPLKGRVEERYAWHLNQERVLLIIFAKAGPGLIFEMGQEWEDLSCPSLGGSPQVC